MDVTDIFWQVVQSLSACDDAEEFRATPEYAQISKCIVAAERAGIHLTLSRSSITEVSDVTSRRPLPPHVEFRNVDDLFRGVLQMLHRTEDRVRAAELQRCISMMESWGVLQSLCDSMEGHSIRG
jgi:hypothetical protein